jgi:alkylated DNA nucleotide flippase Atl1
MVPGADSEIGTAGRPDFVRRVLDVVAVIPVGKVLTYGDVGQILETGGPRQVGAVLARHGSSVPWWRVVNAAGMLPPDLRGEAARHYDVEGTPYDLDRERVSMASARWDGR